MVTVVISGKPGSGSSTVSKLLAKKLGLKHFSVGDYYKKHFAKSRSHAVKILSSDHDKKRHRFMDNMQLRLAKKGNIVIDSKIGIHVIGKNADMKVWLDAGMVASAKRMAYQERIPRAEAMKLLKSRYVNEHKLFERVYGFNSSSQKNQADVVIDTSNKTPDQIADAIISSMKRVFVVHRWLGTPKADWYPYVKKEMESRGYIVTVLKMPRTRKPTEKQWVPFLARAVGTPGAKTYLVGHSAGAITILRYLETLKNSEKIGGCVLVAGWIDDIGYKQLSNFFTKPVKWTKIKKHCRNFAAIHSDNDPYVKMYHGEAFRKHLGAKLVVEHAKGHLDEDTKIKKLPSVVRAISSFKT